MVDGVARNRKGDGYVACEWTRPNVRGLFPDTIPNSPWFVRSICLVNWSAVYQQNQKVALSHSATGKGTAKPQKHLAAAKGRVVACNFWLSHSKLA